MRLWSKPVLRFNLAKDAELPTIQFVDGELVVNFRVDNANAIGSELDDMFK